MAVQATIVLDSGSFLEPRKDLGYPHINIGYFESDFATPDIRVFADGEEVSIDPPPKLGTGNSVIEVIHTSAGGVQPGGPTKSRLLDKYVLFRKDLYDGEIVPVDPTRFDCILRFKSGHFRPSMIKNRFFKQITPGTTPVNPPRKEIASIAHDIAVDYDLADRDVLKLVKNGSVVWSSEAHKGVKRRLDVEILADDGTATKFFLNSLEDGRSFYWIPNQGQPPPVMFP